MTVLRARLHELAERERDAEVSAERRSQVGGGGRSEKIRTYNFKENRVTDHRIGFTIYRLSDVLAGDLDLVVEPLLLDERSRQLAEFDALRTTRSRSASSGRKRPRRSAPATRHAGCARWRPLRRRRVHRRPRRAGDRADGRPPRRDGRYRAGASRCSTCSGVELPPTRPRGGSASADPRPETELGRRGGDRFSRRDRATAVGRRSRTGSGAIGLSLAAELPLEGTTVWITDVSEDALAVAGRT